MTFFLIFARITSSQQYSSCSVSSAFREAPRLSRAELRLASSSAQSTCSPGLANGFPRAKRERRFETLSSERRRPSGCLPVRRQRTWPDTENRRRRSFSTLFSSRLPHVPRPPGASPHPETTLVRIPPHRHRQRQQQQHHPRTNFLRPAILLRAVPST